MEFLHTRVNHAQVRALLAALVALAATDRPRSDSTVLVCCPRCGDEYFAVSGAPVGPAEADGVRYLAAVRLRVECPDHAHRFTLGA